MDVYIAAITDREAFSAIRLTLLVALIVVPLNTIFGVAAAWLITKFQFKGKQVLLSLIELPFAVSPVIAGLVFVLLFTPRGALGEWLLEHGVKIIFSVPGIIIATIFVTFPFVARELITVMQAQGKSEEEAALSLGASGWKMFWRVTIPNIKWGLLYGMILCNARAIGEFGAVSVVSGHVRGITNTMPLHIEILYNEYQFSAAFAVATLMSLIAVFTLVIKTGLNGEWKNDNKGITVSIQIQGVSKQYGTFQALTDIHLDIPKGELVALLGPSGSGKTTLLRIIAGLEEADGGSISFDGEDLTDIHVKNRQVGFVFQHYALFKHMNVFENVAFGLKVRKKSLRPSAEAIEEKVIELLKLVKWMALLNVIQRNYLVDNVNVLH